MKKLIPILFLFFIAKADAQIISPTNTSGMRLGFMYPNTSAGTGDSILYMSSNANGRKFATMHRYDRYGDGVARGNFNYGNNSSLNLNGTAEGVIAIGAASGQINISGQYLTLIGHNAGRNITTSENVIIGAYQPGFTQTAGTNNLLVSATTQAAFASTTGSNQMNIGNIIWGVNANGGTGSTVSSGGRIGVGTNAPAASSILDLTSTTAGLLVPRMNTTQQDAISSPATGLLIYNTDSSLFRFYSGSAWTTIGGSSGGGGGTTSLTVGTTPIASGTSGRILFQGSGSQLQQAAGLAYDSTNKRLTINAITNNTNINTPRLWVQTGVDIGSFFGDDIGMSIATSQTFVFNMYNAGAANKLMFLRSTGELSLGDFNTSTTIMFEIRPNSVAKVGQVIRAATSQTADLQQFQNSSGTAVTVVNAAGEIGVGTTTVAASASVDITSTTKGFLPPRMTTTQKNAISSPAEGLIVYDVTLHKLCVYTGSAWETITSL